MQLHITQSRNLSRVLSNPKPSAHSRNFPPEHSQSRLPPLPMEALPRQSRLQIPVSAFQVVFRTRNLEEAFSRCVL